MEYKKEFDTNKKMWNAKTPIHLKSDFYQMDAFLAGQSSLCRYAQQALGDISGKKILHLQCHFGQDSLSLARMGAKVTGLDFSDAAIDVARDLNERLGLDAKFVCASVYDTQKYIEDSYDLVFVSYGAICWLPDLKKWAEQVALRLVKGGKLILLEFHPLIYIFDFDSLKVQYDYFNMGAYFESASGSYADFDAPLQSDMYFWNHGLSEVIKSLNEYNFAVEEFEEYPDSPYNCFPNMVQNPNGYYSLKFGKDLPHVYSLVATKY